MQLELPFLIELPEPAAGTDVRVRRMLLGGRLVAYAFRRARRRTIGIVVDERGLQAAAPRWVAIAEVEAFMREKERWILARLAERARDARAPFQWREGARLPYLGREIALTLSRRVSAPRLASGRLELPAEGAAAPARLREATVSWLKSSALALYRERVARLAPAGGVPLPTVTLSNARTQWGSCTEGGRVRINWRLIHFALPHVDYVVAHELAHLREMNHSRAFWRVVAAMYPDYEAARRFLRERGHLIPHL